MKVKEVKSGNDEVRGVAGSISTSVFCSPRRTIGIHQQHNTPGGPDTNILSTYYIRESSLVIYLGLVYFNGFSPRFNGS